MDILGLKEKIEELKVTIAKLSDRLSESKGLNDSLQSLYSDGEKVNKSIDQWVNAIHEENDHLFGSGVNSNFSSFYKKGISDILNDGNIDACKSAVTSGKQRISNKILDLDDEIERIKNLIASKKQELEKFLTWLGTMLEGGE